MFHLEFYETENGKKPVSDFLDSLDVGMSAKLVGLMEVLEERGNRMSMPHSKPLEDGIFELRCQLGSNITRVFVLLFFRKENHCNKRLREENPKGSIWRNQVGKGTPC